MHELSIAIEITEIAEEAAKAEGAESISKVELEIGILSGIELDALKFAMTEAVRNTMLENSEIVYHVIKGLAVCELCCNEFETDDHFKACPFCNSLQTNFLKGKELNITTIDIEINA